jgi:hypothetical protein
MWLEEPFWAPNRNRTAARRRMRELLIETFQDFSHASCSHERQDFAAIERLSEIHAPTLVIVGE